MEIQPIGKCVWQGLMSDHVLMMAMMGLPTQSSGPKPNCMARERWPKERKSSGLNQRALRKESGDFLCGEVIQRFEH